MERLAALFYDYVPDMADRRAPYRDAHLDLLRAGVEAGDVRMAGGTGEPVSGGLLIFTSVEAAEAFVGADPYAEGGLIVASRIEPWVVAVP